MALKGGNIKKVIGSVVVSKNKKRDLRVYSSYQHGQQAKVSQFQGDKGSVWGPDESGSENGWRPG